MYTQHSKSGMNESREKVREEGEPKGRCQHDLSVNMDERGSKKGDESENTSG